MIFEAMVIDNSDFFKTGKVRVRINNERLFNEDMRDLSIDPDVSINKAGNEHLEIDGDQKELKHSDVMAYVSTGTIGCSYDSGMFIIPQPNTYGLVARLGYSFDDYKYVWLSGIIKFNELEKTIDGPSDSREKQNILSAEDISEENGPTPNLKNPYNAFVYKQKETHIVRNDDDSISEESKTTLNWEARDLQNMVVVDKSKIYVYHNIINKDDETEGSAVISVDNNNGISISYINEEKDNRSKFDLKADGSFSITNSCHKNVDVDNEVSGGLEGMTINHRHDGVSTMIYMGETQGPTGGDKDARVEISVAKQGNKTPEQISMSAKNGINISSNGHISINPGPNGQLTLGTGDKYIVTADKMKGTSVKVDGQTFYISNTKA